LFFFILTGYSLFLTGLRAAIIGLAIILPLSILFFLSPIRRIQTDLKKNIIRLTLALIIIIILCYTFPPQKEKSISRLENLTKIEKFNFGSDSAINSRLIAWEIAWERIKENPIFGLGLGGFHSYYKTNFPKKIEYPHNLFLELIVELGIIGIIISLYIISILINLFRKFVFLMTNDHITKFQNSIPYLLSPISLILLFTFYLWLSMFSKDIATNSLLILLTIFIVRRLGSNYFHMV
jgi:O-antigen ligase